MALGDCIIPLRFFASQEWVGLLDALFAPSAVVVEEKGLVVAGGRQHEFLLLRQLLLQVQHLLQQEPDFVLHVGGFLLGLVELLVEGEFFLFYP